MQVDALPSFLEPAIDHSVAARIAVAALVQSDSAASVVLSQAPGMARAADCHALGRAPNEVAAGLEHVRAHGDNATPGGPGERFTIV